MRGESLRPNDLAIRTIRLAMVLCWAARLFAVRAYDHLANARCAPVPQQPPAAGRGELWVSRHGGDVREVKAGDQSDVESSRMAVESGAERQVAFPAPWPRGTFPITSQAPPTLNVLQRSNLPDPEPARPAQRLARARSVGRCCRPGPDALGVALCSRVAPHLVSLGHGGHRVVTGHGQRCLQQPQSLHVWTHLRHAATASASCGRGSRDPVAPRARSDGARPRRCVLGAARGLPARLLPRVSWGATTEHVACLGCGCNSRMT